MTKKEKATRRYIFRELRRNPMVASVSSPASGRHWDNIIFFLKVDADEILCTHLKMEGPCFTIGMVIPEEVVFYSNRPRAELRENLNAKIYSAFLGYEDLLINALEERLKIPQDERMGSGL